MIMNLKSFLMILFCTFLVSGPAMHPSHARVFTAGGAASESIPVYEVLTSSKSFKVIGKVSVESTSPAQLVKDLQKKARQKGGDAVLGFSKNQQQILSGMGTGTSVSSSPIAVPMYSAEGIIIQYATPGITEIKKDTPVPVLP